MASRDYKLELDMRVEGIDRLIKDLRKRGDAAMKETAVAIYAEANNLMTESQRIAPKDTGFLRGSAYVTKPKNPKRPGSDVGYAADYAAAVHENTEATFQEPGTRAKFLEIPWLKKKKNLLRNIAKRVAVALQKGKPGSMSVGAFPEEPKKRGKRPKNYGKRKAR